MILSLQRFGSFGLGYSTQRGQGRGPRSGATSCSRSSAGGAALCNNSSPSCWSSGRSPGGSRWLSGAGRTGKAISQLGQCPSVHFRGGPCKARIQMRKETSIPCFTNEKNDCRGFSIVPRATQLVRRASGFSCGSLPTPL